MKKNVLFLVLFLVLFFGISKAERGADMAMERMMKNINYFMLGCMESDLSEDDCTNMANRFLNDKAGENEKRKVKNFIREGKEIDNSNKRLGRGSAIGNYALEREGSNDRERSAGDYGMNQEMRGVGSKMAERARVMNSEEIKENFKKAERVMNQGISERGNMNGFRENQVMMNGEMRRVMEEERKKIKDYRKAFIEKKKEIRDKVKNGQLGKAEVRDFIFLLEKRVDELLKRYWEKAQKIDSRLDVSLKKLKEKGLDTKKVEEKIKENKILLKKLKLSLDKAKEKVRSLNQEDFSYQELRKEFRKIISEIKVDLKNYLKSVRETVKIIKEVK